MLLKKFTSHTKIHCFTVECFTAAEPFLFTLHPFALSLIDTGASGFSPVVSERQSPFNHIGTASSPLKIDETEGTRVWDPGSPETGRFGERAGSPSNIRAEPTPRLTGGAAR
jgi:hypothetical protein